MSHAIPTPLDRQRIRTIIFDYGNTLIEFGQRQIREERKTFERILTAMFGNCDVPRMNAVRDRQIVAPYKEGYREKNLREITIDLVREIYAADPTEAQLETLMRERYDWFLNVVRLPDGVAPLLERLKSRYRLALLSNFPSGDFIRHSLDRLDLTRFFDAIVVSADVGYVKPHRAPFDRLLTALGESPANCLMIGDNWLADIQGGKQLGMQTIHTTQYVPYENFQPYPDDHPTDHVINTLAEIEPLLL